MTAELGKFLALAAFVLCLAQGLTGLMAGARGDQRLAAAAAASAQAAAVACGFSFAFLVALFVTSDFSVKIVVENSHSLKPLIYKVAGTWGNHEGSMLLWCLVSAGGGALLASLPGRLPLGLWSRAVGVQGIVTAVSLAYTLFLSSPFARLDVAPFEGADLNPLLQDPALAAHPPFLYLGYVGMSLPFALAVAALIEGRVDEGWAAAVRPWALAAWTCLTIGIGLGSYWAYYELGWGGWWFWDPVENASFMPWLAAAALLHSAIVTERRGSLASWTILLAILSFGLVLLGAFLVRSGVLTSVHAFAVDPRRGVAVLAMLAAAMVVALGLFAWRAERIAKPSAFALASRESFLILNNWGLAVATGVVLVGTLYPLIVDAIAGQVISVGPPFFNIAFSPLMAVLFLAMPIAPLIAWRRGDLAAAFRKLWLVALLAAAIGLAVALLVRGPFFAALGVALGVWLVAGSLAYLWKRWCDGGGRSLRKLAALPLAAYAMAVAHAGAGILTIGAVAETAFRMERTVQLVRGEMTEFAGRVIRLDAVESRAGPNYVAQHAVLTVTENGRARTLDAERRFYPAAGQPTTEVGILPSWSGDLYVALGETAPGAAGATAWTVRLYKKPMVQLVFIGASVMALGGALALVALALRRRREAREAAPAAAPADAVAAE